VQPRLAAVSLKLLKYVTTAVQGERGGKFAWSSLSRSPQSPFASQLQWQRYKKFSKPPNNLPSFFKKNNRSRGLSP
jgi:hypothetical protein